MAKYLIKYSHLVRSISGVSTLKATKDAVAKNKSLAISQIENDAEKYKVEEFKIISIEKVKCFDCYDTGILRYDGTACFC